MTKGFVDSASIHGAITALLFGRRTTKWDPWTTQSALDTTYVFLHSGIGVIPGPGEFAGASGYFENVVRGLPPLGRRPPNRAKADRETQLWLAAPQRNIDKARPQSGGR